MIMSKLVKSLLKVMGYEINRSASFCLDRKLLNQKRYQPGKTKILDQEFLYTDAASLIASYKEIFVNHIYQFKALSESPVIIDCGSNIGLSIFYFKKLYPNSKIIGIEADPLIFDILSKNTSKFNSKQITLLNRAISNHSGEFLDFMQEGADGGRSVELMPNLSTIKVETIKLDDIITGPIDMLKIDIEGSETTALLNCTKLSLVSNLFIEYHSFSKQPQTLGLLLEYLTSQGFRIYIHTQHCSRQPFMNITLQLDMDLQLNIFAIK